MKTPNEPIFVKVLETASASDVALVKSILDDQGIRYYLQGENTLYLRPLDPVLLMVAPEDAEAVKELLRGLDLKGLWPFRPRR